MHDQRLQLPTQVKHFKRIFKVGENNLKISVKCKI